MTTRHKPFCGKCGTPRADATDEFCLECGAPSVQFTASAPEEPLTTTDVRDKPGETTKPESRPSGNIVAAYWRLVTRKQKPGRRLLYMWGFLGWVTAALSGIRLLQEVLTNSGEITLSFEPLLGDPDRLWGDGNIAGWTILLMLGVWMAFRSGRMLRPVIATNQNDVHRAGEESAMADVPPEIEWEIRENWRFNPYPNSRGRCLVSFLLASLCILLFLVSQDIVWSEAKTWLP
jgi:hypothetical protein